MILSSRITGILAREVPEPQRTELAQALSSLYGPTHSDAGSDRIAAAVIILVLDEMPIEEAAERAVGDWRDLLMWSGLGDSDWDSALTTRFPPPA
ncbi:hypothetical protein [Yinghuangia soli]|uniref:Uncharacterized protein n=1 Tax=Yinghuangia soli TaxID=2908204 RepID=A0AA41QAI6_9ACTN|nr:hypothetical protein [Yinghuangia soli]MCF2533915.1 hypothetical protein [Yinghuangia soli]